MTSALLDALVRASLQGALFAAAVWTVCRLVPRLPAGVRCALWWLACLKILLSLASPLELAWLPAKPVAAPVARPVFVLSSHPVPPSPVIETPPAAQPVRIPWPEALAGLWLTGLLIQLAGTVRQLGQARGIARRAVPVEDLATLARFRELRRRLGLGDRADLRVSPEVEAPQVLGLTRPVVLLPAARPLPESDLSMALCHELVHVRRADLWWGWVPAMAQRLLYFHPLVKLAAREYAIAREAACDAEVLRVLEPEPRAYGRLLLRLGVAPRATTLAAAGAAPSLETLKRRLQMLEQASDNRRLPLKWVGLIVLAALIGLAPIRLVAGEKSPPPPPPAPAAPEAAPAPEAPPAPEAAPAPEAEAAPEAATAGEAVPAPEAPDAPDAIAAPEAVPGVPAPEALPAVAPVRGPLPPGATAPLPPRFAMKGAPPAPMAPPVPPVPPIPPVPPRPRNSHGSSGESFVLLLGDNRTMMNGNMSDVRQAEALQKGDEHLLYFRRGGKAYVVRDAATLAAAEALLRPQNELGEKQGKLGAQQGQLGGKQGELGAKQGALGAQMGTLAAENARLAQDGKNTDDLEAKIEALAHQQEELGRQQEELGRQQEALGRQQEELGRQQEKASEQAEAQLKALVDQALKNGTAQAVP